MKWLALVAAAALAGTAAASARISPSDFSHFGFRQHPGAQLPLDAALRDETGRPFKLGSAFGQKPAILVLEYLRCPNLCGLVLGRVVAEMKSDGLRPGSDVEFVAISIDPREKPADGMAARSDYMARLGTTSLAGWHFLTGDAAEAKRVASAVGFPYEYDASIDQYAHPAGFVVATPDGRIAQYFLGFQSKAGELRAAVKDASKGQTKPPAYPLLSLCLGYDPQPGSVQAAVLGIVRWVSLGLLAALLAMIVLLVRKSRPA